tara:strand:+ start:1062 stop:1619 length:558 start_codon:yes stop_codon:yes gene_type:complete
MSGIINATNLEVANIKDSTGTNTAMTVNNNGTMTPSKMCYSQFGITGLRDATSSNAAITNWTLLDTAPYTTLGSAITHSSGVFTFPHTGKFIITLNYEGYADGGARIYAGGSIQHSSDSGANYTIKARGISGCYTNGAYLHITCKVLLAITDVSTHRVRFNDYQTGNFKVTNYSNGTMCTFEQVG